MWTPCLNATSGSDGIPSFTSAGSATKQKQLTAMEDKMGRKRENKRRNRKNRGQNRHHLVPKSRGGKTKDNLVVLPIENHDAWHGFFGLLTPREAIIYIRIVMNPNTTWTRDDLAAIQASLIARRP